MTTLEKIPTSTVTVKLNAAHRERLKSLAVAKNRTTHFLMKEAIERYLVAEEAQQAVLASADKAAAHYEATGLHITLDDYAAWVQVKQSEPSTALPPCHV